MLGKLVAERGFKTSLKFVTNFCKQHQPQEQKNNGYPLGRRGGGGGRGLVGNHKMQTAQFPRNIHKLNSSALFFSRLNLNVAFYNA